MITRSLPAHSGPIRAVSDDFEPIPGNTIKQYELIRYLDGGGMGRVFLARDNRLGRKVAIKFLRADIPDLVKRFLDEARITAQCEHENIVTLFEADEHQDRPYLVFEYLQGQTLRRRLRRFHQANNPLNTRSNHAGAIPERQAIDIILPVVRALVHAHTMGIVHRDLKPENIMLTHNGAIKVLDFGIATALAHARLHSDEDLERERYARLQGGAPATGDSIAGTPLYMAPEQWHGNGVDHRADIWAIGIILYEMVTGRHPMAAAGTAIEDARIGQEALVRIAKLEEPMPQLRTTHPHLADLSHIINGCLRKRASDRIPSAEILLEELQRLVRDRGGHHVDTESSPYTGLAAFQESDADRFFGRDDDIQSTLARIRARPMVAIIGPTGIGKSSLIRAGVIPACKQSGERWQTVVTRPGRDPMGALAELILQLDTQAEIHSGAGRYRSITEPSSLCHHDHSQNRMQLCARMRQEPGYLGASLRAWARQTSRRILVFIDQFEELYSLNRDAEEREAFLASLSGAGDDAASPLRVVISMRPDYLEHLSEERAFMASLTPGLIFLPAMTRAGLRQALTKPASVLGFSFENPSLVERMLDELREPHSALPLLQCAAYHLWQHRDRERRRLTQVSYESVGGVAGALAQHADHVIMSMPRSKRILARRVFERLVTPENTRAIASVKELRTLSTNGDAVQHVLQHLANARLLIIHSDDGNSLTGEYDPEQTLSDCGNGLVEIVHESLIETWPTLKRWLTQNHDNAIFLDQLRKAAKTWHASGRADGALWGGQMAINARNWDENYQEELPHLERQFLDAVFEAAEQSARQRWRFIYGSSLLVIVLMALAAVITAWVVVGYIGEQNMTIEEQTVDIEQKKQQIDDRTRELEKALRDEGIARGKAESAKEEAEREARKAREATASAKLAAREAEEAHREAERAHRATANALRDAEAAHESERRARAELQKTTNELQVLLRRLGVKRPTPK